MESFGSALEDSIDIMKCIRIAGVVMSLQGTGGCFSQWPVFFFTVLNSCWPGALCISTTHSIKKFSVVIDNVRSKGMIGPAAKNLDYLWFKDCTCFKAREMLTRILKYPRTEEPRFNEVPRDWGNWFVISRFFSIHYAITGLKDIVRYTGDFVI